MQSPVSLQPVETNFLRRKQTNKLFVKKLGAKNSFTVFAMRDCDRLDFLGALKKPAKIFDPSIRSVVVVINYGHIG